MTQSHFYDLRDLPNCKSSQTVIRDPHGNARTKDEVREAFGSSSVDECPDSPESLDQMLNRKNFVKSKSLNQKIEELKNSLLNQLRGKSEYVGEKKGTKRKLDEQHILTEKNERALKPMRSFQQYLQREGEKELESPSDSLYSSSIRTTPLSVHAPRYQSHLPSVYKSSSTSHFRDSDETAISLSTPKPRPNPQHPFALMSSTESPASSPSSSESTKIFDRALVGSPANEHGSMFSLSDKSSANVHSDSTVEPPPTPLSFQSVSVPRFDFRAFSDKAQSSKRLHLQREDVQESEDSQKSPSLDLSLELGIGLPPQQQSKQQLQQLPSAPSSTRMKFDFTKVQSWSPRGVSSIDKERHLPDNNKYLPFPKRTVPKPFQLNRNDFMMSMDAEE